MAAFRTGDTLVWIIGPVLDDSGAAVTGASFSAVSALKPDGTSFAPTYTEIGSGVYKATFVSTVRGLWFLYSQATVLGVVYPDSGSVTVEDGVTIGTATVVVSPVSTSGDVAITAGDSYLNADSRALTWTSSSWPSFASATATMTVKNRLGAIVLTKSVTLASATSIRVDLTATDTALTSDSYRFAIVATLADSMPATLVSGGFSVTKAGA